jgi:hypothetical protein
MDEEAQEVMAEEDLRSGPTWEQKEKANVRNKNNSMVHKLCTVLELEDPKEIVRRVAELVYFKWQEVEFQEPVLKKYEEPNIDEIAATRAEAIQLRNKVIEVEEKADEIRGEAHWFPPEDKDKRDCADKKKLALYEERVNEVISTGTLHAKGKKEKNLKSSW